MELDLNKIRTDCPPDRMKKGQKKAYSNEDKFMISGIQPASHTNFNACSYSLNTTAKYDVTCNYGDGDTNGRVPMTIVPLVNPECFGFKPPGNWQPMDCGNYTVHCGYKDHIDTDQKDKIIKRVLHKPRYPPPRPAQPGEEPVHFEIPPEHQGPPEVLDLASDYESDKGSHHD